jgi:hypothetical protein
MSGCPGEEANRQWAQEQRPEDRRQDPGDEERRPVSVGQHEAPDSRHDQHRGDECRVVRGLRSRRSCREGARDRDAGDRSPWPPGGGSRREDCHDDSRGEQCPGQAVPVEAIIERGLECRGERKPERETCDRSDQCANRADERAVREQHEAKVLLGRADRSEHAELAEPSLRDDGEACRGNERS